MRRESAGRDPGIGADAVDGEVVGVRALPGGGELAGVAAGRGNDIGAGRELEQGQQTAAVQRKTLELAAVDARAGGRVVVADRGAVP